MATGPKAGLYQNAKSASCLPPTLDVKSLVIVVNVTPVMFTAVQSDAGPVSKFVLSLK